MTPTALYSQLGNNSNATSCEALNQDVSLIVLLCLVFFLGFVLNAFSLWVFYCRIPRWSSGTTLQFHLALSDAIASPVAPLMAVYFVRNKWVFGWFLCEIKIALLSSHFFGSTIFLTLISIHRYTAVVHFDKSCRMKQKQFVRKLCAGVWSLVLIQGLVFALILNPSKEGEKCQCLSIHQTKLTDAYFVINFVLFIFGFLLPFTVSVICYTRLAGSLSHLNIISAKGQKAKVKSQRMVGMCLVIFALCFLPLNVIRTVAVVLNKYYLPDLCSALQETEKAYYASLILAGVNSCLDPLLYCFGSQNFRDTVKSLRIMKRDSPNKSDSKITPNQ